MSMILPIKNNSYQFSHYGITLVCMSLIMSCIACDSSEEDTGSSNEPQAGIQAGEMSGEEAGSESGGTAGINAGEMIEAGTDTIDMLTCNEWCTHLIGCALDECVGYTEDESDSLNTLCLNACTDEIVKTAVCDESLNTAEMIEGFSLQCSSTSDGFCEQYTMFCGEWDGETACDDFYNNANPGTFNETQGAFQSCYRHQVGLAMEDPDLYCPYARGEDVCIEQPLGAPLLRRVRAMINRDEGGLGIEVVGRDEDGDVDLFLVEFFFADGNSLQLGENPGPVQVKFNKLTQGNGDFTGSWSTNFSLGTVISIEELSYLEIRIVDAEMNTSFEERVEFIDTPDVGLDEECDPKRGLSRCEDGLLCEILAGGRTRCKETVTECPEFYDLLNLNEAGGRFEGNTSGLVTYGRGYCGGGTSSQVFSFTADQTATYQFYAEGISTEEWPTADPLMWIRSYCDSDDWNAQLGCNDDINLAQRDLNSFIELELMQDQTVYIFVDGYREITSEELGWNGPYILSVTAVP